MFNRYDIMEAWHLFLKFHHKGRSARSARLSKLCSYFEPRPNLSFTRLSDNGQQIYMDLLTEEIPDLLTRPITDEWGDQWYLMWVGAHAATYVYIQASSFDEASEALIDWCDDHCIGAFTGIGKGEYREAAKDLGFDPDEIWELIQSGDCHWTAEIDATIEHVECDMMMVGHTTLKNWDYSQGMPGIVSWEWGGGEVTCEASCAVLRRRVEDENNE